MFSIQVSFYTVDLGPYSEVVNVSTDEGGKVLLMMAVEINKEIYKYVQCGYKRTTGPNIQSLPELRCFPRLIIG